MRFQGFSQLDIEVFARCETMKQLQNERVYKAIASSDRCKRNRAVDWLDRNGKIEGLLNVMDNSRYEDTRIRAEAALSKFSFK